jgi:sugar lactone lactonase YvrE
MSPPAGGGFVVSINVYQQDGTHSPEAGQETGGVFEWSPTDGWSTLPGAQINSANGVAVSSDGRWVYIGGWHSQCIKRVGRGRSVVEADVIDTGLLTDNLTWTSDGWLLAAGAFNTTAEEFIAGHFGQEPRLAFPSRVLRVDPDSLAIETVVEYGPATFGAATTGLQVGDEIWVGAARDQGLARFHYRPAKRSA